MRNRKNDKGAALIVTVMAFAVLAILSVVFITISTQERKLATIEEQKMKAYYIARSGADTAAASLIDNIGTAPSKARQLLEAANPSTITGNYGGGSFTVVATQQGSNIRLVSTGVFNNIQSVVILNLQRLTSDEVFNRVIFTNSTGTLNLDSVTVNGDIETRGSIVLGPASGSVGNPPITNSDRIFESPVFPPAVPNPPSYTYTTGIVTASAEYSDISLGTHEPLTFDTSGGDLHIVVNDFTTKSDIIIQGSGRLFLYIRNSADLQTPQVYNDNPSKLIVLLADGCSFSVQANGNFNGYIYGPGADISLLSSQTVINGSIIGNVFSHNSNPSINFTQIDSDVDILPVIVGYKKVNWED
jgi:hypothetical protein